MDWLDCSGIEVIPGKLSGAPVIKHSRVRPEDVVVNRGEGEAWLAYAYDLPVEVVREVLSFYESHQDQLAPVV